MAVPGAALGIAERVGKAVSQDLVVIGGQWFREVTVGKGKKKRTLLLPISYELHLNPVSLGLGAAAVGGAIALGWFAWNGLSLGFGTAIPGLKDSDYWNGVVGKVTKGKAGSSIPPTEVKQDALTICLAACESLTDPFQRLSCQAGCRARALLPGR